MICNVMHTQPERLALRVLNDCNVMQMAPGPPQSY